MLSRLTYFLAQVGGILGLLAVLAGVGWLAQYFDAEAARADRYERCLPERGERTVSTWAENGLQCTVFRVGAYGRPSELVRTMEVEE